MGENDSLGKSRKMTNFAKNRQNSDDPPSFHSLQVVFNYSNASFLNQGNRGYQTRPGTVLPPGGSF